MTEIKMIKKYCLICKDETVHRGPFIRYFYQCSRCKTVSLPSENVTPEEIEEAITAILFDKPPVSSEPVRG